MRHLIAAAAVFAAAQPAFADEFSASIEEFFKSEISDWAQDPALVAAITAQNVTTTGYDQSEIDALDQAWRAEVGQAASPTITPIVESATSAMLRDRVASYGGQITEIILMDAVGLNVAVSDVTSDFWQGDEDKHSQTFGQGPTGLHIADVEFDESTQRYQGQVSFTIVDPTTGLPVGAMTVGVDAESLM